MLSSTFDPCFWPESLTSELGFCDNALLMSNVGEMAKRSHGSALTECELAMMDAISTIDVQDQLDKDTITVAVQKRARKHRRGVSFQLQEIDERKDSDSDTASEISTATYGSDDIEDAEPTSPGLASSQSSQLSFTSTNTSASGLEQSGEAANDRENKIFDSVRTPIFLAPSDPARGSSETDLLDDVYGLASADASRQQRSRSPSPSPSQPPHKTLTPPKTPVPAKEATPILLPPSATAAPIQFDPTNSTAHIKRETSTPPTSLSSISPLTSLLSTLTSELRTTTSLINSKNTEIDTLSPRLNNIVTECAHLTKIRKSLLAKRKALKIEIDINRDTFEGKKNGANRLREEQIELLYSREQTQNEINVLTQKKREIRKELSKKRYEAALENEFADRGCREIARRMGWHPPTLTPEDDENGEGEQGIFNDDLLLHDDNEEQDDKDDELKEGNEADSRRVAHALINGDRSLDLAALSKFQEGLGAVNDRVKQEDEGVRPVNERLTVVGEAATDGQDVRIKTERRNASIIDGQDGREDDDPMFFPLTTAEEKSVAVGEITSKKIQAKLRCLDHIRDDLAEMMQVFVCGSNGTQGKEGRKQKIWQTEVMIESEDENEDGGDGGAGTGGFSRNLRKKRRGGGRDGRGGFGRGCFEA